VINRMTWRVEGMFCPHCEQMIRGAVSKLSGLSNVEVSYRAATLSANWDRAALSEKRLAEALEEHGYTLRLSRSSARDIWGFAGGIAALILLFLAVDRSPLGTWIAAFPTAKAGMSLGALFLVGLMTSLHCVAMCGGINIAGTGSTRRGAILYNLGRVLSYTVIGAIVGALGSVFSLSVTVQAVIQIFAAAFMLLMALNLLGCFHFLPTVHLPKKLTGLFHGRSALIVGLANGLMPCGPLQAMQLFALSTGSWYMGALSMLCFSLGTVPLMLGIGLVSGQLNRRFARPMRLASAALIAVMGMSMLQNALALSGVSAPAAVQKETMEDGVAYVSDGVQLVHTTLGYRSYAPITVKAGILVRWTITADSHVLNGCNEALVIPEFGIQKGLTPGDNVIEFTPNETGTFPYSCWMGMIRSSITVEP